MAEKKTASIVLFSGEFDKVFAAFTIAIGAASAGYETSLFVTFWGYKAIQKGNLTGQGFLGRMIGLMNRGGLNRLATTKFNFCGIGPMLFNKMMKDKGVALLPELRQTALDLGVHFLACKTTMDVLEIKREDLIDEVEDVVGVAALIKASQNSDLTHFI
jgi:peroxiredoxin family protein